MPLGTADKPDTGHADNFDAWEREMRSPGDKHWNDLVSHDLSSRENTSNSPVQPEITSENSGNTKNIKDIEDQESNQSSNSGWTNNTFKSDKTKSNTKSFLRRFGPTGAVIGLLLGGGIGIMSSTGIMSSLIISMKENVMINLDQQNYTSTSRANIITARRLTGEATTGACSMIKFACRYTKPSSYQLDQLSKHGIKAYDADGQVIEKNRLIAGTRPHHYSLSDGTEIRASEFSSAVKTNPAVRTAFTRAYNPRWVNWVDQKSFHLLKKLGVSKTIPEKVAGAKNREELSTAVSELLGASDKDAANIEADINKEVTNFSEKEAKRAAGKGDAALISAQMFCAATQAPGIIVNVQKSYRMMQYAKIGYLFLTVADKIKKGKATPSEVSNVATILTQTYRKSDGTVKKSAMDSSLMKYSLGLGTSGSSSAYIPSIGSNLAKYLSVVNSNGVKSACAALGTTEAQAVVNTLQAIKAGSGPAGWALLAGDVVLDLALSTDWAQDQVGKIAGKLASSAMSIVGNFIDYNALAEYFLGDNTKDAKGTDIGDIAGVSWSNSMADQASYVGNMPLTTAQKAAFDEQIVNPTKLAWAEYDRSTHSPLDISSPNTFLGSIAARFIPYMGSISNPLSFVSSLAAISGSSLHNFINPTASAKNNISSNMCKQNELLANESNIAIGPACDVQYGIPAEYMGIQPDQVVSELANQLDESGVPKSGSELEGWMESCNNANNVNLDTCIISSRTQALYGLYQIDKRVIDTMDTNPEYSETSTSSTAQTSASGSTSLPDGDTASLSTQILNNPNITYTGEVQAQFQNMANGQPAAYGVTADKRLLQTIIVLSNKYPIYISSMVRAKTNNYSLHPLGEAVDIAMINGTATTGGDQNAIDLLNYIIDNNILPKNAGVGQIGCDMRASFGIDQKLSVAGLRPHEDTCHHLHLALRWTTTAERTW